MPERNTSSPEDQNHSVDVTICDRVRFHMAEFGALKSEIAELVKQTSSHMTFAVTASGGVAAWLLTHPMEPEVIQWARWLPFVVSALFGCFALAAYFRMADKGKYLLNVEKKLAFDGLGWEKTFERRSPLIGIFQFIGWGVLNALSLLTALALPFPEAEVGSRHGEPAVIVVNDRGH